MARRPIATRGSGPEAQRAIFEEMVQGLGTVSRYGPGSVMIHVPKAHQPATSLNHYLRDESSLPKKIPGACRWSPARKLDCQDTWNAPAASARQTGVPGEVVDALRDGKALPGMAADEGAVVHYGRACLRAHRVSRGLFSQPWSSSAARALYSPHRRHSALDYLLPLAYEKSSPARR